MQLGRHKHHKPYSWIVDIGTERYRIFRDPTSRSHRASPTKKWGFPFRHDGLHPLVIIFPIFQVGIFPFTKTIHFWEKNIHFHRIFHMKPPFSMGIFRIKRAIGLPPGYPRATPGLPPLPCHHCSDVSRRASSDVWRQGPMKSPHMCDVTTHCMALLSRLASAFWRYWEDRCAACCHSGE